jgi:hypothetical protein
MTPLLALGKQPAGLELSQMRARRLHSDAADPGKLGRRQRPAAGECRQHVGAGGIADERADLRNVWTFLHTSIVTEASPSGNVRKRVGSQRRNDMITCFIRYQIDPFKKEAFAEYARNWGQAIPKNGADLIGYFGPHEGSATTAYGVYNIESLAAYEAYRARLASDPLGRENYEFARREGFILKEDRIFLKNVSALHAKLVLS